MTWIIHGQTRSGRGSAARTPTLTTDDWATAWRAFKAWLPSRANPAKLMVPGTYRETWSSPGGPMFTEVTVEIV